MNRKTALLLLAGWVWACAPQPPSSTPSPIAVAQKNPHDPDHGSGQNPTASSSPGAGSKYDESQNQGADRDHESAPNHAEGEVELTPQQIEVAGIVVERCQFRVLSPSVSRPATIVGDPDREVRVSARVAGVLDRLDVRVGDEVRQGQVLGRMDSPEMARMKAEYSTQKVEVELAQSNLQRRLDLARLGDTVRRPFEEAQKEVAQAKMAEEAARAALNLADLKKARLEDLLKDGIASQQQVDEARATQRETRARFLQSQLDLQVARTHLLRESRIRKAGLLSDSEAFQAQSELKRSQQALNAARQGLLSLGADPDEPGRLVDLVCPLTGVVISRDKSRGERVEAGDPICSVLDPSRVWCWVDLPDEQVDKIRPGSPAEVRVSAYPSKYFPGKLTFITPQADPDTKKTRARVELDNPGGKLRPNMFAQVLLKEGVSRSVLAVPRAAVVQTENQSVVYRQESPGHFERTPVRLGVAAGDWQEITHGLQPDSLIVTQGVATVQAEDLRSTLGEGGHSH